MGVVRVCARPLDIFVSSSSSQAAVYSHLPTCPRPFRISCNWRRATKVSTRYTRTARHRSAAQRSKDYPRWSGFRPLFSPVFRGESFSSWEVFLWLYKWKVCAHTGHSAKTGQKKAEKQKANWRVILKSSADKVSFFQTDLGYSSRTNKLKTSIYFFLKTRVPAKSLDLKLLKNGALKYATKCYINKCVF